MTVPQSPPYTHVSDWDNTLEETVEAQSLINEGWTDVRRWQREYAKSEPLDVARITRWHRHIFESVFPQFAGRVRGPDYPIEVNLGEEFNAVGSREVPDALRKYDAIVEDLSRQLGDLDQSAPPEQFKKAVVAAAAWCHAEFIRIHPFRDGNGRTGRLIIDYFAYRYGLKPIGMGRPSISGYMWAIKCYMRDKGSGELFRYLLPLMIP